MDKFRPEQTKNVTEVVYIALPKAEKDEIKIAARRAGISVAKFCRQAIGYAVKHME